MLLQFWKHICIVLSIELALFVSNLDLHSSHFYCCNFALQGDSSKLLSRSAVWCCTFGSTFALSWALNWHCLWAIWTCTPVISIVVILLCKAIHQNCSAGLQSDAALLEAHLHCLEWGTGTKFAIGSSAICIVLPLLWKVIHLQDNPAPFRRRFALSEGLHHTGDIMTSF